MFVELHWNHFGLTQAKESIVTYSLLQELVRRDGLAISVSGLNEEELCPLLQYLSSNVTNPQYAPFLLDICSLLIGT